MSYQRKTVQVHKSGHRQVVYQAVGDVESTGFSGRGHTPRRGPVLFQAVGDDVESTGYMGKGHRPRRGPVLYQAVGDAISDLFSDSSDAGGSVASGVIGGGSIGSAAGSVQPKPSGSGSSSGSSTASGVGNAIGTVLSSLFGPKPSPGAVIVPQQGMSDTTKILLAAGAVGAVVLIMKRKG